jgi:hypothetical protein
MKDGEPSERAFNTHDEATAFAVAALRRATSGPSAF